jgi:hypothetical protein
MAIFTKDNVGLLLLAVTFILVVVTFGMTAANTAKNDDYSELRSTMTAIIVMNAVAFITLIGGILLFYTRFANNAHIYNLIIAGVAMFMSFTAVSIAVITKT